MSADSTTKWTSNIEQNLIQYCQIDLVSSSTEEAFPTFLGPHHCVLIL